LLEILDLAKTGEAYQRSPSILTQKQNSQQGLRMLIIHDERFYLLLVALASEV